MRKLIASISTASITFDLWTSAALQGYLGITLHFLNSDWEPQELLIGFEHMTGTDCFLFVSFLMDCFSGHHTAARIVDAVKAALADMDRDLINRLASVTVDGASNVQATLAEFEGAFGIWCFCHIIHLAVRGAFKVRDRLHFVR